MHDTTVLYTSSLTTSAAISAQNNFQGLILGGYIYRYTPPRRYAPAWSVLHCVVRASKNDDRQAAPHLPQLLRDARWINMPLGMEVGLSACNIVLDDTYR